MRGAGKDGDVAAIHSCVVSRKVLALKEQGMVVRVKGRAADALSRGVVAKSIRRRAVVWAEPELAYFAKVWPIAHASAHGVL